MSLRTIRKDGKTIANLGIESGSGYGSLKVVISGDLFVFPDDELNSVKSGSGCLIRVIKTDTISGNLTLTIDGNEIVISDSSPNVIEFGIDFYEELTAQLSDDSDKYKIFLVYV